MKLPRTLHIEGSKGPAGRSDPDAVKFIELSGQFLVIEEKVDGTGVSIFFDDNLEMQIWHRGSPVTGKEFSQLQNWTHIHYEQLFSLLEDRYVLFGEWMFTKHTVFYDRLPHYFLESDIYDRKKDIFLSTVARNVLLTTHPYIKQVPVIASLRPNRLDQITDLIDKSRYQSEEWYDSLIDVCEKHHVSFDKILSQTDRSGLMEGLYIKHEDDQRIIGRYKYVRYGFLETILNSKSHLIDRDPIPNLTTSYNWRL